MMYNFIELSQFHIILHPEHM